MDTLAKWWQIAVAAGGFVAACAVALWRITHLEKSTQSLGEQLRRLDIRVDGHRQRLAVLERLQAEMMRQIRDTDARRDREHTEMVAALRLAEESIGDRIQVLYNAAILATPPRRES